jgi:hypothetical protein
MNTIMSDRVRKLVSATLIQPWTWPIITAPKVSKRLKSQGRRFTWLTTKHISCACKQVVFGCNGSLVFKWWITMLWGEDLLPLYSIGRKWFIVICRNIIFHFLVCWPHTGICRMHSQNLHIRNQFCYPKSETYRYRSSSPVYPVSLSSLPKSLSRWSL